MLDHGVAAPEMRSAVGCYIRLLDEMEAQLAETPWLAGASFGNADTAAAPFLTRIDHLGMGALIAARPRAQAWLGRVQARPAFARAVTDVIPAAVVENFEVVSATGKTVMTRLTLSPLPFTHAYTSAMSVA